MESFDYIAAAIQAYEDFPHIRDKVFFIDTCSLRTLHPSIQVEFNFEDDHHAMRVYSKKRAAYSPRLQHAYFYTAADVVPLLGPAEIWKTHRFIFNHELAHAAIKDAVDTDNRLLQENIADAYAALQHFKADIHDVAPIRHLINVRTAEMISIGDKNKIEHFTAPLLEQIIGARHGYDLTNKTSNQIAELARDIAVNNNPSTLYAKKIAARYYDFQFSLRKEEPAQPPVQILAQSVMEVYGPLTFKWGAATLRFLFNEHAHIQNTGVNKLSCHDIACIQRTLKEKQKNFPPTVG